MDGTKDDALCEDFLGKGVAETEDVVDNDRYADQYDDSPATNEILDYDLDLSAGSTNTRVDGLMAKK